MSVDQMVTPAPILSFRYIVHRGYQMSVGLILNLLNKLNKSILCDKPAHI